MERIKTLADRRLVLAALLVALILLIRPVSADLSRQDAVLADTPVRRLNMPYLGPEPPAEYFTPAIFWFGKVTETTNYADVRMWHYDEYLKVMVNIMDRRAWYDTSPSASELEQWDAITLYLDLDGNTGNAPDQSSYRLVAQLNRREARENWQAGYKGNGSDWSPDPVAFTTEAMYRGSPNDDDNNHGWRAVFIIPFASLGVAERPPAGTTWGLAAVVHDRDDAAGSYIPDQFWPEGMNPDAPASWGQLVFGIPGYDPPDAAPKGSVTIRHGLNGASVVDGHVGGHGNCGGSGVDIWNDWGELNYAGYSQINIQNQWDISDFPCFSKYYVTFPLDNVPKGKVIIAATLQMRLFGGSANPNGETPDTYVQVLTIGEDWDESTLTWNNAPLAVENISGTWVKPIWLSPDPADYQWNVSRAVAMAYQSGEPLRLAMYSADGDRHTGKYFWSSDSGVRNTSQRPTLQIVWGELCDSPGIECNYDYLPLISH